MATTIQDLEKAAGVLTAAIAAFDTSDQQAQSDQAKADLADSVAHTSAAARDGAKQAMIDSSTAFDAALAGFLHPTAPA